MTERHGRGDTRFAGKNLSAVLRGEKTEVEKVALDAGALDFLTCEHRQTKRLRHLARTRLIVPRGAADEQHTAAPGEVLLLTCSVLNALARVEPLNRQIVIRVRETGAGFPRARALVVLVVRLPCDVDDIRELPLDVREPGIVEPLAKTTLEFVAGELHVTLSLAHVDGHVPSASNPFAARLQVSDEPACHDRVIRSQT